MRLISTAFIILVSMLSFPSLGQQQDELTQTGRPISRKEVLELPPLSLPRLALQRALRIAEQYIQKHRIDVSSHYLFEVKLVAEGPAEKQLWQFWWAPAGRKQADSNKKAILVLVTMDGKVLEK
jgi:hypothetical protein